MSVTVEMEVPDWMMKRVFKSRFSAHTPSHKEMLKELFRERCGHVPASITGIPLIAKFVVRNEEEARTLRSRLRY